MSWLRNFYCVSSPATRVAPRARALAWRAVRAAALGTASSLLVAGPGFAKPLSLNLILDGGPVTLSTSADLDALLEDLPPLQLPVDPNVTITLNTDLPDGFALTSPACPPGVSLVSLGNLQYGLNLQASLPVGSVLSCALDTLNRLEDIVGTIVPLLARQNDFLMSLDLGLDRQIDLLAPDADADDGVWGPPFSLGGPARLAFAGDAWAEARSQLGAADSAPPSTVSFATSLRQARQAPSSPPYALGAGGAAAARVAPAKTRFDVWAEGYLAHFEDDTGGGSSDGHTGVLYVGADYLLTRQLLLGTLVQFDDTEQDFDQLLTRASTTGWMAGPYATLRLPSNLYFQARAAWGRSDNEIGLNGAEDHFDAERWLVKGTLLGQWRSGPWQFQPRASVGYIEENQESYVSAANLLIPDQTVSLGQAKAGSQIAYRQRLAGGTVIEPSLLLEGIWNFHEDTGLLSVDDLVTAGEVRGRAEAGVMIYAFQGMALGASVSYDGIGSGDYEAIGGRARLRVPFNH